MDASRPRDVTTSLRRVRWAQALVYSVIGLALVATAVQSWRTVGRVSTEVAAGRAGACSTFSDARSAPTGT